jgi:hypothetical protein
MRSLTFLLLILLSVASYSDTIPNTTSSCLRSNQYLSKTSYDTGENFNLQLSNDTLSFWGIIRHNCCGGHFLVSNISNDTVYLARVDTGMICRCDCPFSFSIKIPLLTHSQYRIMLTNYESFGLGLDTLIANTTHAERNRISTNNLSLRCVPNPSSNSIIINLSGNPTTISALDIFDINGTICRSFEHNRNGVWQWDTHDVSPGTYFVRYKDGNRSVSEKIILQ